MSEDRCERDLFWFLDEKEKSRYEWDKQKENCTNQEYYKEIITKLAIENQTLKKEKLELEKRYSSNVWSLNDLKSCVLDLCEELVNYVDIKKLRKDLDRRCFISQTKQLLQHISDLFPVENEVK